MRRRDLICTGLVGTIGWCAGLAGHALAQSPAETVVAVVARKFVFLPNEIVLRLGQPVLLEFSSPEVVMGFYAPELKLRAVLVPGQVARVRFVPDRVGKFDFLCDIFCGDGHEGMSGHISVLA